MVKTVMNLTVYWTQGMKVRKEPKAILRFLRAWKSRLMLLPQTGCPLQPGYVKGIMRHLEEYPLLGPQKDQKQCLRESS